MFTALSLRGILSGSSEFTSNQEKYLEKTLKYAKSPDIPICQLLWRFPSASLSLSSIVQAPPPSRRPGKEKSLVFHHKKYTSQIMFKLFRARIFRCQLMSSEFLVYTQLYMTKGGEGGQLRHYFFIPKNKRYPL